MGRTKKDETKEKDPRIEQSNEQRAVMVSTAQKIHEFYLTRIDKPPTLADIATSLNNAKATIEEITGTKTTHYNDEASVLLYTLNRYGMLGKWFDSAMNTVKQTMKADKTMRIPQILFKFDTKDQVDALIDPEPTNQPVPPRKAIAFVQSEPDQKKKTPLLSEPLPTSSSSSLSTQSSSSLSSSAKASEEPKPAQAIPQPAIPQPAIPQPTRINLTASKPAGSPMAITEEIEDGTKYPSDSPVLKEIRRIKSALRDGTLDADTRKKIDEATASFNGFVTSGSIIALIAHETARKPAGGPIGTGTPRAVPVLSIAPAPIGAKPASTLAVLNLQPSKPSSVSVPVKPGLTVEFPSRSPVVPNMVSVPGKFSVQFLDKPEKVSPPVPVPVPVSISPESVMMRVDPPAEKAFQIDSEAGDFSSIVPARRSGGLLPIDAYYSLDNLRTMKVMIAEMQKARALPTSLTAEQALMVFQRAYEMGMKPFQALDSFFFIEGKMTLSGPASLGLARQAGYFVTYLERTDKICRLKIEDKLGHSLEQVYTIQDAERAGLAKKGTWQRYPLQMLQWRAVGNAIRAFCPEVLSGMYLREEIEQGKEERVEFGSVVEELSAEGKIPLKKNENNEAEEK